MDAKANVDQLGVVGSISYENIHKCDKISAVMKTENIVHLSSLPPMLDNCGFALSPITPDSNKESSDLMSVFTSPLTMISSPMNQDDDDDDDDDCLSTPKKGVFDPFAPGPDNLLKAPLSIKYLEESRNHVARKLNFNCLMTKNVCEGRVCESDFEDDMLLEAIYDSLLEVIISQHAEVMVGEISVLDSSPDAVKTPPLAPRLTGIAETCPGAPFKSVKKSRNIDMSLCRKLEFDF